MNDIQLATRYDRFCEIAVQPGDDNLPIEDWAYAEVRLANTGSIVLYCEDGLGDGDGANRTRSVELHLSATETADLIANLSLALGLKLASEDL